MACVTFWKGRLNFLIATFCWVTVSYAALQNNKKNKFFCLQKLQMYLNYALGFPSLEVFASSIFVVIKQRRKLLFSVKNRSVSQTLDIFNEQCIFLPKYNSKPSMYLLIFHDFFVNFQNIFETEFFSFWLDYLKIIQCVK